MAEGDKNKLLIGVICLLVVLILLLAGGIGYIILKKDEPIQSEVPIAAEATAATSTEAKPSVDNTPEAVSQKELNALSAVDPAYANKPPSYYQINPDFLINLVNEKQIKYLQIQVQISTRNPTMIADFETYSPLIKHELIELFTSKTFSDLSTEQGKERMRKEALLSIRKIIKKETGKVGVEDVLFTSFLMQ
jgi:flagellar FliL protein